MTTEILAGIIGVVIQFLMKWFPRFRTWFAALNEEIKQLVTLGIVVLTGLVIYATSCMGWYTLVTCDEQGIKSLIETIVLVLIGNQIAYLVVPAPRDVTQASFNAKVMRYNKVRSLNSPN